MMTIWKYKLEIADEQDIEMPARSEVLTVDVQDGVPFIWVKVFTDHVSEVRKFVTYGTGHQIPITSRKKVYIGTYKLNDGKLIFHLFELQP